jgi:hypothetical protein
VTAEKARSREKFYQIENEHAKQWNNLIEIRRTTFKEKAKVAKLKLPFPQNQSKKPVKHKELGVTKNLQFCITPRLKISNPSRNSAQLEFLPYF